MTGQDIPAPRTIKIGATSIGLIGLEQAVNQALNRGLADEEAADFIFAALAKGNYIPPTAQQAYREAFRAEYQRRLRGESATASSGLTIRVLGTGCVTCNALSAMLFDALQKSGLSADMESVQDLDEIWRFGVTKTPALIINGKIKCAGRMPSPIEVHNWVKEENELLKTQG